MEPSYWNGERTPARQVRVVVVGPSPVVTWWCYGLEGQERAAVEVKYGNQTFYLDDEDGSGWKKVTAEKGAPSVPHRSVPVTRVLKKVSGS